MGYAMLQHRRRRQKKAATRRSLSKSQATPKVKSTAKATGSRAASGAGAEARAAAEAGAAAEAEAVATSKFKVLEEAELTGVHAAMREPARRDTAVATFRERRRRQPARQLGSA